jgi:hypothetical protein
MEPNLTMALPIAAAILGACIGSFLNVVAWRLPRQESVVLPPSHCPRCGTQLQWFENLPVLGWLGLRGHCRHCGAPISPRYPLVELLSAGLWVAVTMAAPTAMGPGAAPLALIVAGWVLVSWLLPLVLIDLDHLWLPEPLCRFGLVLGLLFTAGLGWKQQRQLCDRQRRLADQDQVSGAAQEQQRAAAGAALGLTICRSTRKPRRSRRSRRPRWPRRLKKTRPRPRLANDAQCAAQDEPAGVERDSRRY